MRVLPTSLPVPMNISALVNDASRAYFCACTHMPVADAFYAHDRWFVGELCHVDDVRIRPHDATHDCAHRRQGRAERVGGGEQRIGSGAGRVVELMTGEVGRPWQGARMRQAAVTKGAARPA